MRLELGLQPTLMWVACFGELLHCMWLLPTGRLRASSLLAKRHPSHHLLCLNAYAVGSCGKKVYSLRLLRDKKLIARTTVSLGDRNQKPATNNVALAALHRATGGSRKDYQMAPLVRLDSLTEITRQCCPKGCLNSNFSCGPQAHQGTQCLWIHTVM
jgi:hypothetical protein